MKIKKIEWKNIFAYGEELQTIEYTDGELVLLKGISGSGKSAILSLPSLLLYGKIEKVNKSSIANRINKNGWIRGTVEKSGHIYIIERGFSPNTLLVLKDGVNIESFGPSSAQDFIDNEIVDIPQPVFSNMISISMKKFKSFLTMSPADRKQIIDRVFNLEIINLAFEKIKKDAREIGNAINSGNTTLFQLNQTLSNANSELVKLQEKLQTAADKEEIQNNIKKISESNNKIVQFNDKYAEYSKKQTDANNTIASIKQKQYENTININAINEKLNLFSQSKCPTCGTSFSGETYENIKKQLVDLKEKKSQITKELNVQLAEANKTCAEIVNILGKINSAVNQLRADIANLNARNTIINEQLNSSAEFTGIQNIINSTSEQIQTIKDTLSENSLTLKDLQNLQIVYSIDGVKQKVIVNYLPILNQEIENHLNLLNFPYQLDIDSKFEPHLKELGIELEPGTLSDGEETRVDLVILCSLFKLLKRRFPTINLLFIDEVISSLDSETSGLVLDFLKTFAKETNLSCFIVSHTDLYLDNFDKIISVEKNGFSRISINIPTL